MPNLRLSLAISDYVHTRDVADGRISRSASLSTTLSFEQAAFRFGANREFDISEFSLANFCVIVSAPGGGDIVGLPVFPSRVFRHSSIYINEKSGIRSASKLKGRTVGIPQWSQTATVYMRGFLRHEPAIRLRLDYCRTTSTSPAGCGQRPFTEQKRSSTRARGDASPPERTCCTYRAHLSLQGIG